MSVPPESVTPGKCFVTPGNQVRRVLKMDAGKVNYEARGPKPLDGEWLWLHAVGLARFAHAVSREVSCDYDPHCSSGRQP